MGEVVGLLALHTAGEKPFLLLRGRAAHPRVVPKARREGLAASEGAGKERRGRPATQAASRGGVKLLALHMAVRGFAVVREGA